MGGLEYGNVAARASYSTCVCEALYLAAIYFTEVSNSV
jgi:hypothetical protein